MSGFYTVGWCVWVVWATVTLAVGALALKNFRGGARRERRAAKAVLMITAATVVQLVITALVPLPPEPAQLFRVFVGRASSMAIEMVCVWVMLYYDTEIREHEAQHRREEWRKEANSRGEFG